MDAREKKPGTFDKMKRYFPVRESGGTGKMPVLGISEWYNWYSHYGLPKPLDDPGRAIEEDIDAHLAVGIGHIVWSCGRSDLIYRSLLPDATLRGGYWERIFEKTCPLKTAVEYCRSRKIPVLGRLCMNRHYGPGSENHSEFARKNPGYYERGKPGNIDTSRMCYAFEEVQQERIDILLEIQRAGVDALVLDFCRQMPILKYHEALTGPYEKKTGSDPREIHSTLPGDYADWFQFRSDVLTEGFMSKLREQVGRQEKESGRGCSVIARVPDGPRWLMLAYGLDIERWFQDDLVDGTMLSPFPMTAEDLSRHPDYHARAARASGKFCIGGVGSLNLFRPYAAGNTGFFHPLPAYKLAAEQHQSGVDAMSLYQSETLVRLDYLKEFISRLGNTGEVERMAAGGLSREEKLALLPHGSVAESIGMDWHSKWLRAGMVFGCSLSTEISGGEAL